MIFFVGSNWFTVRANIGSTSTNGGVKHWKTSHIPEKCLELEVEGLISTDKAAFSSLGLFIDVNEK